MSEHHSLTGLLMATMLEARPFVERLGLEKQERKPFEIYGNGKLALIISGIGKANAAAACSYLILRKKPSFVCNLGAAGAMSAEHSLGEIRHISKVLEPDRPELKSGRPHEHRPDVLKGFPTAILATQDKPMKSLEERKAVSLLAHLADMEGAAVVQTCRHFGTKCHVFKFVSDTPEDHAIVKNIKRYRDNFCEFFRKNGVI